jgi:hypothetical protein
MNKFIWIAGCFISENIKKTNSVLRSMNTIEYESAHADCEFIPRYSDPI